MELIKKHIHMNRCKGKSRIQITLEEDFNVPDAKGDIQKAVREKGVLELDQVQGKEEKVSIKGKLIFGLLYGTQNPEKPFESMEGQIPLEENINLDGVTGDETIHVDWEMEDLNISAINSRKIAVKAMITLNVAAYYLADEEVVVEVSDTEPVEYIKKSMDVLEIALNKKDIFRIKEELDLPANHPNVQEILFSSVEPRRIETRLLEGNISISGEMSVFVLYEGIEEGSQVQWFENTVPFRGNLEISEIEADQIPHIQVNLQKAQIDRKTDFDGEERILSLDCTLELDIHVYKEETLDVVSDIYSCSKELKPITKQGDMERLFMKNTTKARVSGNCTTPEEEHILQICHCQGNVKVDQVQVQEDGVMVEGVVSVCVLYVSSQDASPLAGVKTDLPFSQLIEGSGMNEQNTISLRASMESLGAMMTGQNEIEIKAAVQLECFAVQPLREEMISQVEEESLNMETLENLPGIVGYLVKEDDTLWNIAKSYYTTMDEIRTINQLSTDNIKKGDKLLVVKKVNSVVN